MNENPEFVARRSTQARASYIFAGAFRSMSLLTPTKLPNGGTIVYRLSVEN